MSRAKVVGYLTALFVSTCCSTFATATTQRTFVRSDGVDNPSCSLTAPCRSFGAAVAATSADGEVIVLDSAGYGRVTVTKSIAIIAPPGIFAGISVFAATNGVDIDTPAIKVALRGLSINGQGGNNGVSLTQGASLNIDRCEISNMTANGVSLDVGGTVTITHTRIRGSGQSAIYAGAGAHLTITDVVADDNHYGVFLRNSSEATIRNTTFSRSSDRGLTAEANGSITRMVLESVAVIHSQGIGILYVSGAGGFVDGNIARSTVTDNLGDGIRIDTNQGDGNARVEIRDTTIRTNHSSGLLQSGGNSTLLLERNVIAANAIFGVVQYSGGTIYTRSDNSILGNGTDVNGTLTPWAGM